MIYKSLILILLCASISAKDLGSELKEFTTDLCTYFKEGTKDEPKLWAHCCIKHDLAYWVAGEKKMRKRADLELRRCVEEVGSPRIANLMYRGIRLGHFSPIKNAYQWGWARGKKRDKFQKLSSLEIDETLVKLQNLNDIDPNLVADFLEFRFPGNNSF